MGNSPTVFLVKKKTCIEMANSTGEGCVVQVYVVAPTTHDMLEIMIMKMSWVLIKAQK